MSDNVTTTVASADPHIAYTPTDAWAAIPAPGSTNGQSEFLLGDSVNGKGNAFITFTFPEPATGVEYWGYQRSDGGNFSICFECSPTSAFNMTINALNTSTNGSEAPRLLYSTYDLTYAIHNLTIGNQFDTRATINGNGTSGGYGQMSLDRFVLIAPAVPPTTSTSTAASSTSASPSATSAAAAAASSSSNAGAIAGGVVGGVAALALLALLVLCLFRRKRKARSERHVQDMTGSFDGKEMANEPHVMPFVLGQGERQPLAPGGYDPALQNNGGRNGYPPSPSISPPSHSPPSLYSPGSSTSRVPTKARPLPAAVTRASEPLTAHQLSPSVYPPSSSGSGGDTTSPVMRIERERDAGWLAGGSEDGEEEMRGTLPPDYDSATARRRELAQGRAV